jgi:histidinol-phosphate aminotransferase
MLKLVRTELQDLKVYDVAKCRGEGVWLNANESPWEVNAEIVAEQINRYPIGTPEALMDQLSEIYKIEQNQLLLTRGSDEGIDLLVRLFCTPYQDAIMIFTPTFVMYKQSANLQGAKVIEVPLQASNDFKLNIDSIDKAFTKETKILFICSPNNPTGGLIPCQDILKVVERVKDKAIVVVDEAYIEFAEGESMTLYVNQFSNLVVLRTLSKAFGLAGLRFGILIAQAPLIEMIRRIMPPYPFSVLTLSAATAATTNEKQCKIISNIAYIKKQREIMAYELSQLRIVTKVWQSESNFLLVEFKDPKKVAAICALNKIYLRELTGVPGLEQSLRMTIGLEAENQQLTSILKEINE